MKGMTRITEAFETSAIEYVKTTQQYAIKEEEIWTHLVELGFAGNDLTSAYLFFIDKPDKLRAFLLGVPVEMRKVKLQPFGSTVKTNQTFTGSHRNMRDDGAASHPILPSTPSFS